MKVKNLSIVAALAATLFFSFLSFSAYSQSGSVEQRLEQLEQQLQTRNQLQSEMSLQLTELQKEVKLLLGTIEEQQFKLKQIQERQRDIYREIDTRFSAISSVDSRVNTTQQSTPNTQQGSNSLASSEDTPSTESERKEFESVFQLVRRQEYEQAIAEFNSFLERYPYGSYSGNALFWLGQVYFVQSKLVDAEQKFERLIRDFPKSSKVPAGMLKLAEIKAKRKKYDEAKVIYKQVMNNYSGSTQQLASKGLQALKDSGH